ncbi:MAG: hypothetical protein EAS48_09675 [Chryseobacterium sp.]|nr:MAG: hypothetical protein EAS48_09675 [Chryseobacterium sp.]
MASGKKRIILGLPKSFGMDQVLEKALEEQGYEVINISYVDHAFRYKNIGERLKNFIHKTFLGDKNYKNYLKFKRHGKGVEEKLRDIEGKTEYALLIRADIYPANIVKLVKNKTQSLVAYQWDGMHRFPGIYSLEKYFDKFYIFDKVDMAPGRNLTGNFYFDRKIPNAVVDKKTAFFVGSYMRRRMNAINHMAQLLKDCGIEPQFFIYSDDDSVVRSNENENVRFIRQHMDYNTALEHVLRSDIVVDFLNDVHRGLSFRVFEALGYGKKLITNNKDVAEQDFYNPANIFIWKENSPAQLKELRDFIDGEMQPVDENIIRKYAFSSWIDSILNG